MLHLALNPDQQAGCREEVDNLFNSQSTDSDFDCDLTMDDLSNLKLVERCILESSRVTPSIPVFIRRLDTPLKIGTSRLHYLDLILHDCWISAMCF